MTSALAIAFMLVALAELGDKTQLLVLALATRYRPVHVAIGVAAAVAVLQLAAVLVGASVGALLPRTLIALVAGALFILFGVIVWPRGDSAGERLDEDAVPPRGIARIGPVFAVAGAFFLAELGDKTQLMTVSIAADPGAALRTLGSVAPAIQPPVPGAQGVAFGVWLGSTLGMLVADGAALLAGVLLGRHLPQRAVRKVSAVVFVLFGLATLAAAFLE